LGFGKYWLTDLAQPAWFAARVAFRRDPAAGACGRTARRKVKLGEPLGTLILTLSVIGIEVMMIAAVMSAGHRNVTLARDAMLAVLMSNQLQRSVNLLLGSVLASISLTVPAALTVGFVTDQTVVLGLDGVDTACCS
jgi:Ca2+/H+ antiporter